MATWKYKSKFFNNKVASQNIFVTFYFVAAYKI